VREYCPKKRRKLEAPFLKYLSPCPPSLGYTTDLKPLGHNRPPGSSLAIASDDDFPSETADAGGIG